MGYEESFITIKLIWHGYLILSLIGICVHETPTKIDLKVFFRPPDQHSMRCTGGVEGDLQNYN